MEVMSTENQVNKRIFFVNLFNYFRLLHHAAKQYNLQFRFLFLNTLQMAEMAVNLQICILPDCAGVIDDNIRILFPGYFFIANTFHDTGHCLRLQGIHLAACILDKESWRLFIFFLHKLCTFIDIF